MDWTDRFWEKVDVRGDNDCWNWIGPIEPYGWGNFGFKNKQYKAHRVSYELINGPIEGKFKLKQTCSNMLCVNPQHLVLLTPEYRFWSKVKKTDTCWIWTGAISDGYGEFRFNGRMEKAYRFSFYLYNGYFPAKPLTIDHLCRNRKCVNPKHLEVVTNAENILRGFGPPAINSRKTHCKNGHEFNDNNTSFRKHGGRRCNPCRKIYG